MIRTHPVSSPEVKIKSDYDRKRQKLKNNPVMYEEFKAKDALNHRKHRRSMTDAQRKSYNEKAALRMRKYRERKKEMGLLDHMPMTRKKVLKQREYWRLKKREQRGKMSPNTKKAEKEKRRKLYALKKTKSEKNETEPTDDCIRKAKRRLHFPKDPKVFASVVRNLATNLTPKKKHHLHEKGVLILTPKSKTKHETNAKIVARLKVNLKKLKTNQTKRGKQLYYTLIHSLVGKHAIEKQLRQALDLKWSHWCKLSLLQQEEIPKSDSLSTETKDSIKTFYETESVTLPTKKTVLKDGTQKKVLTETLQSAFSRFRHENPGQKISLSSFKKQRPKQILTMDKEKFRTCLCEYCLNIEFKLESINRTCELENQKHLKLNDRFDCVKMSLCDKDSDFNKRECLERNCSMCGVHKITTHFQPLSQMSGEKTLKWKRWEARTIKCAGKDVRRQMLVEKEGSIDVLLMEFAKEMGPHANHTFVADWQRKQYRHITQNLPEGWVVSVADFAENYRCVNQDEIQSAYYNYQQATLFTMVYHYRCPTCKDNTVQESAVFVSSDLKHDADAVNQFTKQMNEHIQKKISIEHYVQFSDGCGAQFKSKKPFLHLSEERSHSMERCYFGSRHGKSACDALGGLVKNQAERFVKSRKVTIQNAKALFQFCQDQLAVKNTKCTHKLRTFFYVEEVKRDSIESKLQTVKGTQTFHDVRGVSKGVIIARHLTCFCPGCIQREGQECEHLNLVGSWEAHSLFKRKKDEKPESKSEQKKQRVAKENRKEKPLPHKAKEIPCDHEVAEMSTCLTFAQLKRVVYKKTFCPLPSQEVRTFENTEKTVDKVSLTLMPNDIPLSDEALHPAVIYGDGNCLPRSASVLAYGHENKHKEMRERIVCELVKNADKYLDNKYMKIGMNPDGNCDVIKTFASYSGLYVGTRLNKATIRKLYELEVLSVCKNGEFMGLWQLASLANVLSCPVVSVYPKYGSHTVRRDMHRIFYPFENVSKANAVHILWTNTDGAEKEEKEFTVNHFVVLMPLVLQTEISIDSMSEVYESTSEHDDSFTDNIWNIISDLGMESPEQLDPLVFEELSPQLTPPTQAAKFAASKTPPGSHSTPKLSQDEHLAPRQAPDEHSAGLQSQEFISTTKHPSKQIARSV